MAISIFADQPSDFRFDEKERKFVPAATGDAGPIFGLRPLNYWEAQVFYDKEISPADQVRKVITGGLVTIDGKSEEAARFLASPGTLVVNALAATIQGLTLGN